MGRIGGGLVNARVYWQILQPGRHTWWIGVFHWVGKGASTVRNIQYLRRTLTAETLTALLEYQTGLGPHYGTATYIGPGRGTPTVSWSGRTMRGTGGESKWATRRPTSRRRREARTTLNSELILIKQQFGMTDADIIAGAPPSAKSAPGSAGAPP